MTPSAISSYVCDYPVGRSAAFVHTYLNNHGFYALNNDSSRNRSRKCLMSIVSRKHSNPVSSATVDSHASPRSAGTSARAPPLSAIIGPKLEATILHPLIPSGSMNAQQFQEPLLLWTRTKRSIYPNRSTLGPSETSDRPGMALAMTPGTTILPQGSISTKFRRKGLKRSKKGLATATTGKSDMPAVKPPMLP